MTYKIWNKGFMGMLISIRNKFFFLVHTSAFENFILFVVAFNTLLMILDDDVKIFENSDFMDDIIAYVFALEMVIKLIGLTPGAYFRNGLNCFDGFITILSIIVISNLFIISLIF